MPELRAACGYNDDMPELRSQQVKRWNMQSPPPPSPNTSYVPAYSFYSITDNAAITLKGVVEFAAFLSETGVFAYLGLQVVLLLANRLPAIC